MKENVEKPLMNNIELVHFIYPSIQSNDGYVIIKGIVHNIHFTCFNSVLMFKVSLKKGMKANYTIDINILFFWKQKGAETLLPGVGCIGETRMHVP